LNSGHVLLFRGVDSANEADPSRVDEDFNTELDDFLGRED